MQKLRIVKNGHESILEVDGHELTEVVSYELIGEIGCTRLKVELLVIDEVEVVGQAVDVTRLSGKA